MKFGQWVAATGVSLAIAYLVGTEVAGHKTPTWPYWLGAAITIAGLLVMAGTLIWHKRAACLEPTTQLHRAETTPGVMTAKPDPRVEQDAKHDNVTVKALLRRPPGLPVSWAAQAENKTTTFTAPREELIASLGNALTEFRSELDKVGGDPGADRWPPLTDSLRAALHKVREVRDEAGTAAYTHVPDIPAPCHSCGGQGVTFLVLDEVEGPNWFEQIPCRSCLTTGFALRL